MTSKLDLKQFRIELNRAANPQKAVFLQRFFKTGKGQYAYGDIFLGLTVPQSRILANKYKELGFADLQKMLQSKFHEERLITLLILVERFKKAEAGERVRIKDFYLKFLRYVNNWDLVDLSADKILGIYLLDKPKTLLFKLAKSSDVWRRRVAVVATYQFIKHHKFETTKKIAATLLKDKHDLIHKAVGWMLREVGKRDERVLKQFLQRYAPRMPRTMLRYAIERFPEKARKAYLKK